MGQPDDPESIRNGPRTTLAPGKIQYSLTKDGLDYAIIGGGSDGKVLLDYAKVLVDTSDKHKIWVLSKKKY